MKEKYSLNEETLKFIIEFEKNIEDGTTFTNTELVKRFNQSIFYKKEFEPYIPEAKRKAIWYAVKRSRNWDMTKRGIYIKSDSDSKDQDPSSSPLDNDHSNPVSDNKVSSPNFNKAEYIRHLSKNLYDVLILKRMIQDDVLKKYHLSSKGIGDDLYFLTESFFRQRGLYKGKHSMSDYITPNALKIIESGNLSKNLIYEHMIPKNIYIKDISEATVNGQLTEELIYNILNKYYYVCTVTKEEDKKLPSIKMTDGWDGINPFFRYEMAEIDFVPNRKRS